MECTKIELQLSEYLERALEAADMQAVAEHLHRCRNCATLLDEMRSLLATCQSYPVLEPDNTLIEKILVRTSGRPRTRTLGESLRNHVFGPMFTPRFAVGAVLATLFLALVINFMLPRVTTLASTLSPSGLFRLMDHGVQEIYGGGLKLYDMKSEWQEQFTFYKNTLLNRLGFMIERLDVPADAKKKSEESQQPQEKAPGNESRLLLLPGGGGKTPICEGGE